MSRISNAKMTVSPERMNPEFLGIAEKYNKQKRNRLSSDQQHRTVSSNYSYTMKLDEDLGKSLNDKEAQLERLKKIRQRHNEDIRQKMLEEQRRRRQLERLKNHNQQKRENLKNGIMNAQHSIKNSRINNTNQIKEELYQGQIIFNACYDADLTEKNMRHRSIQMDSLAGNQRINSFHRKNNQKAIENYYLMMRQEDRKNQENNKNIHKMSSTMKSLQKRIKKKQHRLKAVLEQINEYAVEATHQRKTQMLATNSFFRKSFNASTKSQKTSASRRSKPQDVLKVSHQRSFENNQTIQI